MGLVTRVFPFSVCLLAVVQLFSLSQFWILEFPGRAPVLTGVGALPHCLGLWLGQCFWLLTCYFSYCFTLIRCSCPSSVERGSSLVLANCGVTLSVPGSSEPNCSFTSPVWLERRPSFLSRLPFLRPLWNPRTGKFLFALP